MKTLRKYPRRRRPNAPGPLGPAGADIAEQMRGIDATIAAGDVTGPLMNARRLVSYYYPDRDDAAPWYDAINALIGQASQAAA